MSAWGYPPEPDWVGQQDVTCSMTDVERKVITPAMQAILKRMFNPDTAVADPWLATRGPEEVAKMRERVIARAIGDLKREIGFAEELTFSCTFDGETEVTVIGDRLLWTCPVCGEEHDDTAEDDRPEPYDTVKEAEGWA
jgi:hypothetical protein